MNPESPTPQSPSAAAIPEGMKRAIITGLEESEIIESNETWAQIADNILKHLSPLLAASWPKAEGEEWKAGDFALLSENDAFGTRTVVVIKQIHKGGNCIVQEHGKEATREVSIRSLSVPTGGLGYPREWFGDSEEEIEERNAQSAHEKERVETPHTDFVEARVWDRITSAQGHIDSTTNFKAALDEAFHFAREQEQTISEYRRDIIIMRGLLESPESAPVSASEKARVAAITDKHKQIAEEILDTPPSYFGRDYVADVAAILARHFPEGGDDAECAKLWRDHYRKTFGHPWDSKNKNYQGL